MKIVTHDSSFHTDDVFAVATMLLLHPDAEVVRSRDPEIWKTADAVIDTGFVYDPQRLRFDHHMPEGAGLRENGIPYASFGLVWKEYGVVLTGEERAAALIDRELVQPIDAHDNGVAIAEYKFEGVRDYAIGDFFSSFLIDTDGLEGPERMLAIFMQVVSIAKDLLAREIIKAKAAIAGEDAVRKYYAESADKRLIELPTESLPWRETLNTYSEPLYVIYPRRDTKWGMKAVPDLTKPYGAMRKPLPEGWAGKDGAELQKITGVGDAMFAHRALFVAAAASKEGILQLAHIALNS